MVRFILRRLVESVLVVLAVVLLTFIVVRVLPGNPLTTWLGPHPTAEQLEIALQDDDINSMLLGWGNLSANPKANQLDRLIVYLTIEKSLFRLGDVVEALKAQGLTIELERINESLERLVLGYVVRKRKGNFEYEIPLLRERILEDDLAFLIEGEVLGLQTN